MSRPLVKEQIIHDHTIFLPEERYLNLTEHEKIEAIKFHFKEIMEILGLDLTDDSLKDTPDRVARMYIQELFSGLKEDDFPAISAFNNSYNYTEMLHENDIPVYAYCEQYFMPFMGKAHVAYFPGEKVIGLSKINRIVRYFSKRPQAQERLTNEIAESLKKVLQSEDVAVFIEAKHFSIASRGIEDTNSVIVTSHLAGRFTDPGNRETFLNSFSTTC